MDTAYERSLWILQQNPENESGLAPRAAKDVQGLLRHEKPTLAAEVYMQEIPETVRRTVNSIHKELRKRRPGVGRKP
jgi:hypothetical protein